MHPHLRPHVPACIEVITNIEKKSRSQIEIPVKIVSEITPNKQTKGKTEKLKVVFLL